MLTWEAPKEMIFEMPVRNFSLPDPRGIPARRRSRAAPVLSWTPLSCRGGLFFGTPRRRALRDRDVRDGRLAPFRLDANFGIASGPVRSRKPRSSRAFIPALVSKQSPASRRREEFCRDSSTDRFPLPVTFTLARQTGGAAIMRKGPNLLKLARKEQCLALLNSMRAKNKINGCVYRVFPSGEVQYLHPKDGVYPEKVNKGRVGANNNMRSIGKNANPASIKFGGKMYKDGLASDGAGFSRVFDQ